MGNIQTLALINTILQCTPKRLQASVDSSFVWSKTCKNGVLYTIPVLIYSYTGLATIQL